MNRGSPWARPPGGPELVGEAALLAHEHDDVDAALAAFVSGGSEPSTALEGVLQALQDLRRHIYSEEEFLFPPLTAAGLVMPVAVMRREHVELWLLVDDVLDAVAAGRANRARDGVRRLLTELADHNAKEERVVYSAAERLLSDEQKRELNASLHRGLPTGWTCGGV